MTQYLVKVENDEFTWMLRSTTWTSQCSRADVFNSTADAQHALQRAKKFMRPALFKRAEIIPLSSVV